MAKKMILKRPSIPVPQSLEEAEECLGKIGETQNALIALSAQIDAEIQQIQQRYADQLAVLEGDVSNLLTGLHAFAESHRDELLIDGLKSVKLRTGSIAWRKSPPAVKITGKEELIIERIKALKLDEFIRTQEKIDREAMLKNKESAEAIDGVKIKQKEGFFAKPLNLNVELTISRKKAKVVEDKKSKKKKKPEHAEAAA
ncbi:MAG TPA: host-nuclease inhibitor Gam family protein [Candidatus Andersenbacteria bacterium]|nr:host-nuclease inhibitor Gam family protein [Candidatus Andersenbacteria bacterium]